MTWALLSLLALALAPSATSAWRGGGGGAPPVNPVPPPSADQIKALFDAMEHQAALLPQSSPAPANPSCFFLSLASLPSSSSTTPSTSPCDILARSDSARIEAAASMALCEIQTAGDGVGRVPRECEDWKRGKSQRGKVNVCVEALSRSPQHWSSYSQNLREVVTLCSSYRRWADVETARDLYSSSATAFARIVAELRSFEALRASHESATALSQSRMATDLTNLLSKLTLLTTSHSASHETLSKELEQLWKSVQSSLERTEERQVALAKSGMEEVFKDAQGQTGELVHEVRAGLRGLLDLHGEELLEIARELKTSVGESMDAVQLSASSIVDQQDRMGAAVLGNAAAVDRAVQTMEDLMQTARELSDSMTQFMASAIELRRAHTSDLELVFENLSLEAAQARRSSFGLDGLGTLWWLSAVTGIVRGGCGISGVVLAAIAYVAGMSHPVVASSLMVVAVLASLYPALNLAFSFLRWIKPTHPSSSPSHFCQQEIEYRPSLDTIRPAARQRRPPARIPARLYTPTTVTTVLRH